MPQKGGERERESEREREQADKVRECGCKREEDATGREPRLGMHAAHAIRQYSFLDLQQKGKARDAKKKKKKEFF